MYIHVADALSVMAMSLSPISLTISWILTDAVIVESYTISYSSMGCISNVNSANIAGSMTMYTLTGLEEGTEYTITVTAMLTGGSTGAYTERVTTVTIGTQKSLNFKKGNIGMANMYKKQRRQDRDGLVMMAR